MTDKRKHRKRILYIYPGGRSTFMAKDIRLLSSEFDVDEYNFPTANKKMLLWYLLKQKMFLLFHLSHYDLFLIKFAGYWSLLPVIFARFFGKKSMIITGGTDCTAFPSIGYGNFQNKILSRFTAYSFKNTDRIIALHKSMIISDYSYVDCVNKKQGIKNFIPKIKTPFDEIPNGYDAKLWVKTNEKQTATFITVASGLHEKRRQLLKGIDLIIQVAEFFPDAFFYIVGAEGSELPEKPANVITLGKKTQKELVELYSQARFYLQLSMSEGFPNSLCEAMLCECVPVVSNVASMPFIVGDSGFVLEKKDVKLLKSLIDRALKADTEALGKKARQRIAENFTIEQRQKKLVETVKNVLGL